MISEEARVSLSKRPRVSLIKSSGQHRAERIGRLFGTRRLHSKLF